MQVPGWGCWVSLLPLTCALSTSMPTKTLWLPLAWLVATATVTVTPVSAAQGHGLPVPDTPLHPLT